MCDSSLLSDVEEVCMKTFISISIFMVFAVFTSIIAEANEAVYTVRSWGQLYMLEEEACRFQSVVKGVEDLSFSEIPGYERYVQSGRRGVLVLLDCRELKSSGRIANMSSASDYRVVVVDDLRFQALIGRFGWDSHYSIWVSTAGGWWLSHRQGGLDSALVVQVLSSGDTPFVSPSMSFSRLIVSTYEVVLLYPEEKYPFLSDGQCGYPTHAFLGEFRVSDSFRVFEALTRMFSREDIGELRGVFVEGCDASGLYNLVRAVNKDR